MDARYFYLHTQEIVWIDSDVRRGQLVRLFEQSYPTFRAATLTQISEEAEGKHKFNFDLPWLFYTKD